MIFKYNEFEIQENIEKVREVYQSFYGSQSYT